MTLEEFKEIPAGEVFRVVTTKYHTVERIDGEWPTLMFVCKKGHGYDDWTIYFHYPEKGVEWICRSGDKVSSERNIRSIFPCSDDVYSLYRH
jgi:hypothetical protein